VTTNRWRLERHSSIEATPGDARIIVSPLTGWTTDPAAVEQELPEHLPGRRITATAHTVCRIRLDADGTRTIEQEWRA
jgi:hypothetical protein